MQFDKNIWVNAWNHAVDVHEKSGKAKTQLRPRISIAGPVAPNPDFPGRIWYQLYYDNGMMFVMDEEWIASIVHSYTALASRETGNAALVEKSWFDEQPNATPARAKGK